MSPFGIATIRPIPHSSEHFVALQKQARVCGGATDFLRPTLTLPTSHVKTKLRPTISRICLLTESNPWFAFCHSNLSVSCSRLAFTVQQWKQWSNISAQKLPFSPFSIRLPRAVRRTPQSALTVHLRVCIIFTINTVYFPEQNQPSA